MPSSYVFVNHKRNFDAGSATAPRRGRELLTKLSIGVNRIGGGAGRLVESYGLNVNSSEQPLYAKTNWNIQSGSGAVGLTLNGVNVTTTWATSDTATASALVPLINNSTDARIQYMFHAGNLRSQVTLTSVTAGAGLHICGYDLIATAAATGRIGEFSIGGTDAQDATALGAAVIAMPGLNELVFPIVASNVVAFQFLHSAFPVGVANNIKSGSSTMVTSSTNQFTASNFAIIRSTMPGRMGNVFTVAATGTGVAVGAARLAGGSGYNSVSSSMYER